MPWFKIDDAWHSHPKVREAGNAAAGLWVRVGSYCSQYATEGYIRASVVHEFGTKREVEKLLNVGLLAKVEGGYQIPDFLDFNPSSDEVKAQRKASAERQKRWREKKAAERQAEREGERSNAVSHSVSNGVTNATPTRPVPSLPLISIESALSSSSENTPSADDDDGFKATTDKILDAIATHRSSGARNRTGYRMTVRANLEQERHAVEIMLRERPHFVDTPDLAAQYYDVSLYRGRTA